MLPAEAMGYNNVKPEVYVNFAKTHSICMSIIVALLTIAHGHAGQIQDAIDAAEPGDVVLIDAGTYYESIVLKEGITLLGDGADNTVIDGAGSDVVVSGAKNAMIVGFTIQNGQVGVHTKIHATHIFECHIRQTEKYAIQFNGGFGVIGNNLVQGGGMGFGIHAENANPYVFNNVIAGYSTGFLTRGPHQPTSVQNVYAGNKSAGILVSPNAAMDIQDSGFFANRLNILGHDLGESDTVLTQAPSISMPDSDTTIEEYRDQIAAIMGNVFSEYPVVVYTLGDITGDFGMAALHARATFRVKASAPDTEIVNYDAFDLVTQDELNSEYLMADQHPAISVSNPEVTENECDRYALDTLFRHSPSYYFTEEGFLVFNRMTSYTRIEVVVPQGFIPVSSDHETIYEWQDDQVVAKITDIGETTINLVMAPMPETSIE